MEIYLPIAGLSVNVLILITLGAVVGFLSGLFGVGGGFLLTPLLMMIGIPPAVAAASGFNQIIATAASGAAAHYRMGNIDVKMGTCILAGGIAGGTLGVQVVKILRNMGNFDFTLRLLYVLLLGLISFLMLSESLKSRLKNNSTKPAKSPRKSRSRRINNFLEGLPLQTDFPKVGIRVSVLFPFAIGAIVGLLAAVMGVGGGVLLMPMMIYIMGMPTIMAVGTSLFQTVLVAVNVTVQQAVFNHTVDIVLAITLFTGSVFGAQIGADVSQKMPAEKIRSLFAVIILIVMLKMLFDIIIAPENVISILGGN